MSKDTNSCGPCSLCERTSSRYFHTENWDSDKYTHFTTHILPSTLTANEHICICRACHHDIHNNVGNENHMPRWKKLKVQNQTEYSLCPIQGCTNNADVTTTAISLDDLPKGMKVTGQVKVFCSHHYHYIYNYQQQAVCKTCGVKAKIGETFSRCCPNPPLIEKYLRATRGFSQILTHTDKVCNGCYSKHTQLLETYKTLCSTNQDVIDSDAPISIDSDLDILIIDLKTKVQSLEQGTEEYSLISTTILVAETIRNQKAILLPTAATHFLSGCDSVTARSTRWLLRQLEEALGHHLRSVCKHRKYGTILYRNGGDLFNAISCALGSTDSNKGQTTLLTSNNETVTLEDAVHVVGEEMNSRIHQLAAKLLSNEPFDYRIVDFDQIIESTDPQLWRLISQ